MRRARGTPSTSARAAGSRQLLPGYKILAQQPSAVPPRSRTEEADEDDEDEGDEGDEEEAVLKAATTEDEQGETSENERLNALLESIGEGAILSTAELLPSQHFTEPPPRFSEGSLVRCVCIPSPPSSRSRVPHLHSLACRSQHAKCKSTRVRARALNSAHPWGATARVR